jgi:zinc/manganese transport system substrate-binding protein
MSPILSRRSLLALAALPLISSQGRTQPRPVAVASFSIIGDMLRQLAGEAMEIRVLAGPETDAHHFQPRPSDAEALRGAALVLRNGLGFDAWIDRLLRSTSYRGVVVTATEGITPRRTEVARSGHAAGAPDPHAWQDVRLAAAYAEAILAGLAAADPSGTEGYRAAGQAYAARLAALDAWVRERLGSVPPERRVLVTSHDAFGYFAAAYGVRVLAPQGMGGSAQPSAGRVAALIRQIRQESVTAVFLEGPGSQVVMRQIARDAGVHVGGRLYADTLSPPDGPAASYEAMMRHNVELMVAAMLGRQAP